MHALKELDCARSEGTCTQDVLAVVDHGDVSRCAAVGLASSDACIPGAAKDAATILVEPAAITAFVFDHCVIEVVSEHPFSHAILIRHEEIAVAVGVDGCAVDGTVHCIKIVVAVGNGCGGAGDNDGRR